jgi:hypothetical protein
VVPELVDLAEHFDLAELDGIVSQPDRRSVIGAHIRTLRSGVPSDPGLLRKMADDLGPFAASGTALGEVRQRILALLPTAPVAAPQPCGRLEPGPAEEPATVPSAPAPSKAAVPPAPLVDADLAAAPTAPPPAAKLQKVKIAELEQHRDAQLRQPDLDTVKAYAERMREGASFPPVQAVRDGKAAIVWDGWHRIDAAKLCGQEAIEVEVQKGSARDAILLAAGANAQHGRPRSPEEKRAAVLHLLQDAEWGAWSSREIARRTATSHTFVETIREALTDQQREDLVRRARQVRRGSSTYRMKSRRAAQNPVEPAGEAEAAPAAVLPQTPAALAAMALRPGEGQGAPANVVIVVGPAATMQSPADIAAAVRAVLDARPQPVSVPADLAASLVRLVAAWGEGARTAPALEGALLE